MAISRRGFLKTSASVAALGFAPVRFPFAEVFAAGPNLVDAPIQRAPLASSAAFNGDDIERTHAILWDIAGYVQKNGGMPLPSEETNVAVVGGGVSGLTAAYNLRGYRPVVLEQDRVLGGNSKGEQVGNSIYGLGAAYVMVPPAGSDRARFFADLGLTRYGRTESGVDTTVFHENRFAKNFWQGTTDPAARAEFERFFQALVAMNQRIENSNGEEPWVMELDSITFQQWLFGNFGRVHPQIVEYLQLYAWSSFAASIEELSAYQMLGFIAAETGSLMAFPGGNAAIAQTLTARLRGQLGDGAVRSSCLVINIRQDGESMIVTWVQPDGSLKALRAKTVIFAAPKFAAKHVIADLPKAQADAMSRINYRGYVVANILMDRPIKAPSYELYHLQNEVPPAPSAMKQSPRPFTDIVFGSWAQHDQTRNGILTAYKGYAFDGARQFLFNPAAHNKNRDQILQGVRPLMAAMNLGPQNIVGIRMTRWGHSLPVAGKGMISSGLLEKSHQPVAGRLFFANQDNWANPSFETAFDEAASAAAAVDQVLRGRRR